MQAWFSLFCIIDRGQWTLLNNETNAVAVLSRGHLSSSISLFLYITVIIWLKYCWYGVKQFPALTRNRDPVIDKQEVEHCLGIQSAEAASSYPTCICSSFLFYIPALILSQYKMTLINMKLLLHALEVS